jgi:hypothetical protein
MMTGGCLVPSQEVFESIITTISIVMTTIIEWKIVFIFIIYTNNSNHDNTNQSIANIFNTPGGNE